MGCSQSKPQVAPNVSVAPGAGPSLERKSTGRIYADALKTGAGASQEKEYDAYLSFEATAASLAAEVRSSLEGYQLPVPPSGLKGVPLRARMADQQTLDSSATHTFEPRPLQRSWQRWGHRAGSLSSSPRPISPMRGAAPNSARQSPRALRCCRCAWRGARGLACHSQH